VTIANDSFLKAADSFQGLPKTLRAVARTEWLADTREATVNNATADALVAPRWNGLCETASSVTGACNTRHRRRTFPEVQERRSIVMTHATKKWLLALAPLGCLACAVPLALAAKEFEQRTSYYEDDAWYDVSEWLDGNDYNPTDEVFGRWDDETYDWNAADSDQDNDASGYGYDKNDTADDWYYDYDNSNQYTYRDYQDRNNLYDYSYSYYDFDGDGFYDAVYSSRDTDADGKFDDYTYYSFNTGGKNNQSEQTASTSAQSQQQASRQNQASSKQAEISGTVENIKRVKVRNGPERLVAQVSGDQSKKIIVDLGPANQIGKSDQQTASEQPQTQQQSGKQQNQQAAVQQGDTIKARGLMLKVGDKQVLVAHAVTIGNQKEQQINRSGQQLSGQITKMKTVKVRGQDHQLAIIKLQSGQQALVDLGPADNLQADLAENDQIQVNGVPVKVQDRLVFVANSVSKDGNKVNIERTARKDAKQSS
jgi:hypothetical protein